MNSASLAAQSEIWKAIPGVEGYEVSDAGQIRSIPHIIQCSNGQRQQHGGQILRLRTDRKGYVYFTARIEGKRRNLFVHQVVLTVFTGPRPDGMEGCHFPDRCPSNNRVGNLRWDTRRNNHRDKRTHATNGAVTIQAGQTFSRLTAMKFHSYASDASGGNRMKWIFRCICGVEKALVASRVISGAIKSCGCLGDETRKDSWRQKRSGVKWIAFNGKRMSLSELAREIGMSTYTLQRRIADGWPVDKAVTIPVRTAANIEYQGLSLTAKQWQARTGINRTTIKCRLKRGWTVENALTLPVRVVTTVKDG